MQNKGVITFLAVILALASIYQLSFTYATYRVKKAAKDYAQGDYDKERIYLDSVANIRAYPFPKYTFKECQEREINMGLDLKGGMNVILEVSVSELIVGLADNSTNQTFREAIKSAKVKQANATSDFITLFYESFKEIDPNLQLNAIFSTYTLKDRINSSTTDDDVLKIIRQEAQDAIDNSLNVLRSRIDKFGVVQPNIQKLEGNSGRILIELPGIKEPKRVRKLLQGTANLQFWETYDFPEVYEYFYKANAKLRELNSIRNIDTTKVDTAATDTVELITDDGGLLLDTTKNDNLLLTDDSTQNPLLDINESNAALKEKEGFEEYQKQNPLFALLIPYVNKNNQPISSATIGYAHLKDTAKVNEVLNLRQIKSIFPKELVLAWEVKPMDFDNAENDNKDNYFRLIALKSKRAGKPSLEGDVVVQARAQTDPNTGQWEVSMSMNAEATGKWAAITKDNVGKQVAIVLDGYVYSAPNVNSEIKGGSSSISGNFTHDEASDLANILKSGKLQAPAIIIEEEVVGASLGQKAVTHGMMSFIIAFFVILIYMVFFYKTAGIVADIALITNILLIFGVLASLRAVLTLPGIAGIVLTIGMSVDANVLIFERIKEELKLGKGLKLALSDGYKNAYSAIIDANITTLITAIVLFIFGHGPIKGFATTLIIGILTSLFSAIFITRLIFANRMAKGKSISFYTKMTKNAFQNTKIKFIEKRKIAYIISGIIIVLGLFSLFTKGLNLGVDFQGGRIYTVQFDKEVNTSEIAASLQKVFEETPEVKTYGSSNQVKIVTKYMVDNIDVNADDVVEQKLYEGLKAGNFIAKNVTMDAFLEGYVFEDGVAVINSNAEEVLGKTSSRKVGPTIADDIKVGALWAVFFSLIAIFLYIFIRFRNWQFGLGALAALAHDVLLVLGLFSLLYNLMPFSMEINQAFIAAILTVVGYSVNDTVVVFDRIREFMQFSKTRERKVVYNDALNSTLSRTFSTSLSTFVVLLAIFLFGGEAIQGFIFALLIGIVVGTYSSLFIATPVVFDTVKDKTIHDAVIKQKNREYLGGKKKSKK
ncbi:MAG: protein translocase subunit SecDF [Bacteroidales bacterium]|nr:protein translocase subunit SecDF [Bacteroidales bacterium]